MPPVLVPTIRSKWSVTFVPRVALQVGQHGGRENTAHAAAVD